MLNGIMLASITLHFGNSLGQKTLATKRPNFIRARVRHDADCELARKHTDRRTGEFEDLATLVADRWSFSFKCHLLLHVLVSFSHLLC